MSFFTGSRSPGVDFLLRDFDNKKVPRLSNTINLLRNFGLPLMVVMGRSSSAVANLKETPRCYIFYLFSSGVPAVTDIKGCGKLLRTRIVFCFRSAC